MYVVEHLYLCLFPDNYLQVYTHSCCIVIHYQSKTMIFLDVQSTMPVSDHSVKNTLFYTSFLEYLRMLQFESTNFHNEKLSFCWLAWK
jgi:hypothetical protein